MEDVIRTIMVTLDLISSKVLYMDKIDQSSDIEKNQAKKISFVLDEANMKLGLMVIAIEEKKIKT